MTMTIKIDYLREPKLQFGDYFEHEDAKTGLAEFGPFGKNIAGLHPSEIKLGFIGTRETISGAIEWVERCGEFIESENIKVQKSVNVSQSEETLFQGISLPATSTIHRLRKILNRDFIGFNSGSTFSCRFQVNPRWERILDPRDISSVLDIENKRERIWKLVDFIDDKIGSLAQNDPSPDIILIALTPEMEERAHSVRLSGNFFLNLRRAIKARAMQQKTPIAVQLLRTRTIQGKSGVQEVATRAWNFCTAQYYKAGGVPWRPISLEKDTCYVGVSFYIAQDIDDTLTMRSSVAQAFDYLGQGLVLRGEKFEWDVDTLGPTPHLTREASHKLIKNALTEYVKLQGVPPKRVVVHKTSEFWGKERGDYNEIDGFYEGIDDIYRCEVDFVALRQTGVRLFREGKYPPLRGTYFSIDDAQYFLYTMGFIPYLETSPAPYVPEPWQMIQHIGGSAPKDLFREVLALTKMNVNNCAFADGRPITISFAEKVGEIMKHIPEDGVALSKYRFYM
jgi:hypothetical protein